MNPPTAPTDSPRRPSRRALRFLTLLLLGCACGAILQAQEAKETIIQMEKFVAVEKADDPYSVLPSRTSDSLFGTEHTLIDVPRSMSILESDLMTRYGIKTVNDFVAVTAGTFTGNYFGVPGALDVRGERADNFYRGFRRVENRGNFPTSVESTDHIEVIKGPAPPIYGGGKVGGILNYVPKTAKSETAKMITEPTGKVTTTIGAYNKLAGTAEYGAPFSFFGKKAGFYAFGSDESSRSYYNGIYNKDLIGQIAVNVELTPKIDIEFGGMAQHADLNQSLGWNRVTQDLIDHGNYISGQPLVQLTKPGESAITPADLAPFALLQFAFTKNFAPIFLNDPSYASVRSLYALDPATVKIVHLNHHQVQDEAADFAKTDAVTGYFDVIDHLGPNTTLKNQTFADNMNHLKYSSYGFTARYKDYVFENKTTASTSQTVGEHLKIDGVAGFSFRYTDGDEGESRDMFQVMNRRDISVGPTPNTRFQGAYNGTMGYNWREIGASGDLGGFALLETTLFDRSTLTLAAREDRVTAHSKGFTALGSYVPYVGHTDSAFTGNMSINFKLTPTLIPYITYAKSRYVELGQGGMIAVDNLLSRNWIQPSKLTEAGVKYSAFQSKFFASLAVYRQEKSSFDSQAGAFDFYHARGVEGEMRYAPTKQWSLTAAATWQRTDILNAPFFISIPPQVLGFTNPAQAYGGNFNGVGGLLGLNGPLKVPSPDKIFSLFTTYVTTSGLGVTFGGTQVSSYYAGYFNQIKLPQYVVCNASVFYTLNKHWSASLQVQNLFNTSYFTPQFLFQEVFISPSQGTRGDLVTTYKW
jgi:iron complex outermembrane receptor protein